MKLFSQGSPVDYLDLAELKKQLIKDTTVIEIAFAEGSFSATAWGCDLTEDYVKINAEYVS